jgi:transcriptional regulator with XRE-family HTH domain
MESGIGHNARVRLKMARGARGLHPSELAEFTCSSSSAYYDLENVDDEIIDAISFEDFRGLCSRLGITVRWVFNVEESAPRMSWEEFSAKISAHLKMMDVSLDEFEDAVGYAIRDAVEISSWIGSWNIDCLQKVCREIGVNWVEMI